ncbi:hypothetical protein [Clostridium sp.]|uniref:hypothetical protein n=1 Tax=Clostridium sp. TaxID=1506 RepID=UPI002FDE48E5
MKSISARQISRCLEDSVKCISDVVSLAPEDKYIFIVDQLNTHKSESFVKYVAKQCDIEENCGVMQAKF